MRVLYFGYWYPGGGHMLCKPSGYSEREDTLPQELRRLDGPFAGDPAKIKGYYDGVHGKQTVPHWDTNDQEQGLGRLHHVAGWTVLAFWDRSGDTRGSSNSAFLAEGELSFEEMRDLAQEHFPSIWTRITNAFTVRCVFDDREKPAEPA